MADRAWNSSARMRRDVGTQRIPVTGERCGADGETARFCFQFKLRRAIPACLFLWLSGIVATAIPKGKTGVLVLKRPRMADTDALIVVRWSDWCELVQSKGERPAGK
jgi:hypothetical protein